MKIKWPFSGNFKSSETIEPVQCARGRWSRPRSGFCHCQSEPALATLHHSICRYIRKGNCQPKNLKKYFIRNLKPTFSKRVARMPFIGCNSRPHASSFRPLKFKNILQKKISLYLSLVITHQTHSHSCFRLLLRKSLENVDSSDLTFENFWFCQYPKSDRGYHPFNNYQHNNTVVTR